MSEFHQQFLVGVRLPVLRCSASLLPAPAHLPRHARRLCLPKNNTTGHVWDEDLTEMNNPMPRWWMWLFVITIVFGFHVPGLVPRAGQVCWPVGLV